MSIHMVDNEFVPGNVVQEQELNARKWRQIGISYWYFIIFFGLAPAVRDGAASGLSLKNG